MEAAAPGFKRSDILTVEGEQRLQTMLQASSGTTSGISILMGVELLQLNWINNPTVQKHQAIVANGGKAIGGPLLIIHGDMDPVLSASASAKAAEKTAELFPDSQVEHITLTEVTHVPALFASSWVCMD
ncbi:hypothetical protein MMC14_000630 [Varicellaria rhodocarpa]|nr:hypothetical protein [Varicellaria rhodocarpa]